MAQRRRFIVPALLALGVAALWSTVLTHSPAVVPGAVPAPTSVSVSVRGSVAVITWAGTSERYLVEVATDPGFTAARSTEATGSLAVVDDLVPKTRYLARVSPITLAGKGTPSETVGFTTLARGFPLSPPAVTLSSTTSTSLTAAWTDVTADARYLVEFSLEESFADPNSSVVTAPEVTFKKLSHKRTYYVRARVVDSAGERLSEWSAAVAGKPLQSAPLTVGTYNILKSARKDWSKRKPALVRTILGEDPDVVGLQEATPARRGGTRQYVALTNALGSDWALVDASSGSTGETRTIYNITRLQLISSGHHAISGSKRYGGFQRYVTWAVFTQRATGKRFMFVNTHFAPRTSSASDGHRVSAARQLVAAVKQANTDNLPVVVAGDFNTGKNRTSSNRVYTTIVGGGYRDPLATGSGRLGHAEKTIRANVKTVNRYRRVAPRDSFAPMVDHIFVSPMRVKEWEVVARLDSRGRFIGTIPSDHNMLRATVVLP